MESVRWNQHSAHLTHSVSELYKNLELTDCILDVEGKSIYVHKTILAACSPYFKNLLKNDPAITRIPIQDVTYKVMKLILEFVYYGEADVFITDVYSLMKTAELFEMTSLKHIVCHCFQIDLPCKDTNAWSMEDKCSVSCTNLTRHDAMDLLEEQVPLVSAVLHTGEARLNFNNQSSHVHAIGDSSAKHLNSSHDVSGKSNTDQLKSDTPITFDSFMKNVNQDSENMSEELVPLAFVAVSEIKEPIEGHQDSVSEDPLGEYSGILDDTEERSVKKEFTFQSAVQVKKEPKDDNDVPKSMADDVLRTDELSRSFLKLSSTKCNLFESCDQESGMDMNPQVILSDRFVSESCTSEKSHDLEVKFESICEISGADVKEKKVFGTVQYLTHNVDDNTRNVLLNPESLSLNSDVQHISSIDNKQYGNEEDCDSSASKVIIPFALELGTKTPALYKTPASSPAETIFGDVRKELKKKMKGSDSSSHNGESVHSAKVIKLLCNVCCKSFRNVSNLNSHMTSHTREKGLHYKITQKSFNRKGHRCKNAQTHFGIERFDCPVCNKSVGNRYYLRIHMRTHRRQEHSACKICKKTFSLKRSLELHLQTHTGGRPFECEICKKTFSRKGDLNRHIFVHNCDRRFECEICKKTFSRKGVLNSHILGHKGVRSFECEICKKTFSQKGGLNRHILGHIGVRPFECEICKKTFSVKGDLNRHKRVHEGDRPFECEICKKTFSEKRYLKQHILVHNSDRPFECEICKKTFSSKGYLKKHILIHNSDRPFECEICKKTFSEKRYLKPHILVHNGYRPFECEICKKTFSLKGDMNKHKRVHFGDRPFECEICKKTFSRKGDLKHHILVHNGFRPFECEICKKTFSRKGDLKHHILVHNGYRPFECEICKKTFSRKGDLNKHIRVHNSDRQFECEICNKTYFEKTNLKQHMRTHKSADHL